MKIWFIKMNLPQRIAFLLQLMRNFQLIHAILIIRNIVMNNILINLGSKYCSIDNGPGIIFVEVVFQMLIFWNYLG